MGPNSQPLFMPGACEQRQFLGEKQKSSQRNGDSVAYPLYLNAFGSQHFLSQFLRRKRISIAIGNTNKMINLSVFSNRK